MRIQPHSVAVFFNARMGKIAMFRDKPTSKAALAAALQAHKEFGRRGAFYRNEVLARNVLHQELGWHAEEPMTYEMGEDVRDRLIAHCRQDAAHAVLNGASALDAIKSLRRLLCLQFVIIVVLLFAMHAPK